MTVTITPTTCTGCSATLRFVPEVGAWIAPSLPVETICPEAANGEHVPVDLTTGPTVIWTTNPRGEAGLRIVIEPTPAAERAALAFLARHMPPYTGGSDYRVSSIDLVSDGAGEDLIAYLFPTCQHGMDATLCAGPDHYLSAEQERALYG